MGKNRKQYVQILEQTLKKLLLAGLISLSAIASSPFQAQASKYNEQGYAEDTLCISDDDYLWTYGQSDFCGTQYGYSLFTEHGDRTSMIMANSYDGQTLRMSVSEVAVYGSYKIQIGPTGDIWTDGDRAVFDRYQRDFMTMVQALTDFSDFDLNSFVGE